MVENRKVFGRRQNNTPCVDRIGSLWSGVKCYIAAPLSARPVILQKNSAELVRTALHPHQVLAPTVLINKLRPWLDHDDESKCTVNTTTCDRSWDYCTNKCGLHSVGIFRFSPQQLRHRECICLKSAYQKKWWSTQVISSPSSWIVFIRINQSSKEWPRTT